MNAQSGTNNVVIPLAKSTPTTQASQMPISPTAVSDRKDILEPLSNEQARTAYLERQIQGMSSVRLPLDTPSLEDTSNGSVTLVKKNTSLLSRVEGKKRV